MATNGNVNLEESERPSTVNWYTRIDSRFDGESGESDNYASSPRHLMAFTDHSIIDNDVSVKENLFVLFPGREVISYLSIPVIPLLYPNNVDDVKFPTAIKAVELEFRGYPGQSPRMTWVDWGCGLYLIGCGGVNTSNHRFALFPPELKYVEIKHSMNSDKGLMSRAIEHKGIIYVLSTFFVRSPKHSFESYNPKEDAGEILKPPPVKRIDSYVVIGNKICVSTKVAAFAYDIDVKAWEPCYLFGSPLTYLDGSLFGSPLTYLESGILRKGPKKDGLPFRFSGKAFIYGDCLIGIGCNIRSVMGFLIDSGEIVKEQMLFSLTEIDDDFFDVGPLVELGKGYFCIIYTRTRPFWNGRDGEVRYGYDHVRLVVLTFKISRFIEGSRNRILVPPMCSSFVTLPETSRDTFLVPQICSSRVFDVDKPDDDYLELFPFAA